LLSSVAFFGCFLRHILLAFQDPHMLPNFQRKIWCMIGCRVVLRRSLISHA
jgi:hypothetical protein